MHLLCDFKIVVSFWNNVSEFISSRLRTNIVLRKQHMLFSFDQKGVIFCFLNGLLICARFLIYRCKYSKSKPDMLQYYNSINLVKKSEYIIANKTINCAYISRNENYFRIAFLVFDHARFINCNGNMVIFF